MSHSSFSIARRYLARIFVRTSTSLMSIRARMRASRRVAPISGKAPKATEASGPDRSLSPRRGSLAAARSGPAGRTRSVRAVEHVDEPARAVVPEPEPALQHRRGGGAHLRDQADRLFQQRVLVGVENVL